MTGCGTGRLTKTAVVLLVLLQLPPVVRPLRSKADDGDHRQDYIRHRYHPYEVQLSTGRIRGEELEMGAEPFTVFKGIPYARPPVGRYRFKKADKPAPWRGVKNVTLYRESCYQFHSSHGHKASRYERIRSKLNDFMSEDCLYLNVYSVPYTNDTYPVIVFFHPGGFQIGSATDFKQGPILQHFVARGVVVVTVNYRLGPFGFLTTKDKNLPSNNGLWDCIRALEWVQKDIHAFGGDPDRVTLMGQGSGAAVASLLSISPAAISLFNQTILMSGTALTPGIVRETSVNATWALNKRLECRAQNSSALAECLKPVLPQDILGDQSTRTFWDDYQEFVPVVDESEKLLPEDPARLASHRRKKPLLLGTTKDESSLSLLILARNGVNMTNFTALDAHDMVSNLTEGYRGFKNTNPVTLGCIYEYVHSRTDPTKPKSVVKDGILEMYSHFWYTAPTSALATYYYNSKVPTYLYSYDHISERLFVGNGHQIGAFHGSDMILLFETDFEFLRDRKDRNWQLDRRVTEIFGELLTNFVKNGEPTPEDSGFAFKWTPFDGKTLNYLSITDSPELKRGWEDGYHWRGHVFWNWYKPKLEETGVENFERIQELQLSVGNWQMATIVSCSCAIFFLAILIGLAFYCTRKDADEDEL